MNSSINWIDALVGASIAYLAYKGYRRGLIRQVVSLAGLVVGFLFSSKVATLLEQYMVKITDIDPRLARVIAYSLAFIVIVWLANSLARVIQRAIHFTPLAFFNKLLGAVLSPAITLILLSYLFVLVDTIAPPLTPSSNIKDPRRNSRCYEPIKRIVPTYVARFWEELPQKKACP